MLASVLFSTLCWLCFAAISHQRTANDFSRILIMSSLFLSVQLFIYKFSVTFPWFFPFIQGLYSRFLPIYKVLKIVFTFLGGDLVFHHPRRAKIGWKLADFTVQWFHQIIYEECLEVLATVFSWSWKLLIKPCLLVHVVYTVTIFFSSCHVATVFFNDRKLFEKPYKIFLLGFFYGPAY